MPEHIRSDNGAEFIARILQQWLAQRGVKTLYIESGSPWQNGHIESFNGSLRDECLDREIMPSVAEPVCSLTVWTHIWRAFAFPGLAFVCKVSSKH